MDKKAEYLSVFLEQSGTLLWEFFLDQNTGFYLREVCTEYFSVTADGPAPPVICGSNKGQHMIVGLYLSNSLRLCLSPRQPRLDPVQMLAVTATH